MLQTPHAKTAESLDAWATASSSALRSKELQGRGIAHRIVAYLRGRTQPQPRLLKQIETLRLSSKSAVYLVECDGDRFLIAGGGDSLSAPVPLTQRFAARDTAGEKEPAR